MRPWISRMVTCETSRELIDKAMDEPASPLAGILECQPYQVNVSDHGRSCSHGRSRPSAGPSTVEGVWADHELCRKISSAHRRMRARRSAIRPTIRGEGRKKNVSASPGRETGPLRMRALLPRIQVECLQRYLVTDLLNRRGHDWHRILRVPKLQMHPAAYKLQLQHRSAPSRPRYCHLHRLRTKLRVSR